MLVQKTWQCDWYQKQFNETPDEFYIESHRNQPQGKDQLCDNCSLEIRNLKRKIQENKGIDYG